MKVVFLADSISEQKAGIHYFGIQLIKQILDKYPNHEYIAISTKTIKISNLKNTLIPINQNIPFHYRIRQFTSIPKFINNLAPDIVIELAHFGPFRLAHSILRLTVIHDIGPLIHPRFHSFSSFIVHKLLLKNVLDNASGILVNSESTKNSIVNYYNQYNDKIQICYPKFDKLHRNFAKRKLKDVYFLSIGTIEPRKNLVTLLQAYKIYRDEGGKNKLVLAGQMGWKTDKFIRTLECNTYKHDIILTGYLSREDLSNYLHFCDALISCSLFEGFGLPVYEGLLYNKPLILSNIPVYKEIASSSGLFFDLEDSTSLSNCMLGLEKPEQELQIKDLLKIEQSELYIPQLVER